MTKVGTAKYYFSLVEILNSRWLHRVWAKNWMLDPEGEYRYFEAWWLPLLGNIISNIAHVKLGEDLLLFVILNQSVYKQNQSF